MSTTISFSRKNTTTWLANCKYQLFMYKAGEINEQCCAEIFEIFIVYLSFKNKPCFPRRQRTRVLEHRPDEKFGLSFVVARARNTCPWHCLGPRVSGHATMARAVTPQLILWFSTFVVTWVDSVGYYQKKKQPFISVSSGACILSGPQCSCVWTSFTSWDHKIRMSLLTCHQMF